MTTALEARFWAKVKHCPSGCWEWTGACDTYGYGLFKVLGRLWKAHRFAYVLSWGDIRRGLLVCHHCDNPKCVKPGHLWLGTHTDNSRDRERKGRHGIRPRGLVYRRRTVHV